VCASLILAPGAAPVFSGLAEAASNGGQPNPAAKWAFGLSLQVACLHRTLVSPTVQLIWLWQNWWGTKRVGTGGRGVKLSARCSRNGWRRRGHPFWLFSLFHGKMDAPNGCSVGGPEWQLQCPDASQTGNGWPDGWPVGASLTSLQHLVLLLL